MKKYFIIALTISSILFYSCSGESENMLNDLSSTFSPDLKAEVYEEVAEIELEEGEPTVTKDKRFSSKSIKRIDRKLIKEGSISFETDDCKKTKELIHQVTNGLNGYLARDDENTYDYQIKHNISIRVPSENFDELLVQISESIKELDDKNITVKDVTEEYVDVQARIKAKKIVEQRFFDLLNKAHSIGDVLQVESELARLREQIESKEGRLRYLKDQVSLSTLNITFYQNIEVEESGIEFFSKIANGFNNGFEGLLWFFIGLVNVWPFLLFLGLGTWLVIRLIRKPKKNIKE